MSEAFVWGSGGEKLTPDQIAARRKIAEQLAAKGGDYSPVQHWAQGLARVSSGLLAGLEARELDKAEKANREYEQSVLTGVAGGASPAAGGASTGAAPSFAGGDAARAMAMPEGDGKDISNRFLSTVQSGGITNPFGLAAVAAYGSAESGWNPKNVYGSWSDPSESGQAGTSGGALSWRAERLANLRKFGNGDMSPETQAKFFLNEDPSLVAKLNAAKTPEEAHTLMANAWRFAGYNRQGGEYQRRLDAVRDFVPQFQTSAADMAAPGASPAGMAGAEQGFKIPPAPVQFAETEEDVRRLEAGMMPPQAAMTEQQVRAAEDQARAAELAQMPPGTNRGDVFSPVPMGAPNGFSPRGPQIVDARQAVAEAAEGQPGFPHITQNLPPVRPQDLARAIQARQANRPAPGAVEASGQLAPNQAPVQAPPIDPTSNDAGAQAFASSGMGRTTAPGSVSPIQRMAQALMGRAANDNAGAAPARETRAGMSVATGGASPTMAGGAGANPTGVAQAQAGATGGQGVPTNFIQAIADPRLSENGRRIASILLQRQLAAADKARETRTVDLGNAIGIIDQAGNVVQRIAKDAAPAKPEVRELNGRLIEYTGGQARDITPQGLPAGYRNLTSTEERALYGIPADDRRPYQVGPDGKLNAPPGGTTVTMVAAEKAEEAERGKGLAKRLNDIADDGAAAEGDLAVAQRLDTLMRGVQPGMRTALLEEIRKTTGLAIDPNADSVQAAGALIEYLVPRMRVSGSGASSDRDMAAFRGSLASLRGTPGGNEIAMQTIGGLARMRTERAAIAQEYQLGEITAKEAMARMRAMPDPFAAFKDWQAAQKQGATFPGESTDGRGSAGQGQGTPPLPRPAASPAAAAQGAAKYRARNPQTGEELISDDGVNWRPAR